MKKLIVNPIDKSAVKMLNVNSLLSEITEKAFRQKADSFKPVIVKEDVLKRFISNVEYRYTSISPFLGCTVNTFDEAVEFLKSVGKSVYSDTPKTPNTFWWVKVIKMEVDLERNSNAEFGILLPNMPSLNDTLKKELRISCDLEINEPATVTKIVLETKADANEAPAEVKEQTKPQNKNKGK